jgi:hypothetical protein
MPEKNIEITWSPQKLKAVDKKMHREDLERQKALKNNPPTTDKRVVVIGTKSPQENFYRFKYSNSDESKKSA